MQGTDHGVGGAIGCRRWQGAGWAARWAKRTRACREDVGQVALLGRLCLICSTAKIWTGCSESLKPGYVWLSACPETASHSSMDMLICHGFFCVSGGKHFTDLPQPWQSSGTMLPLCAHSPLPMALTACCVQAHIWHCPCQRRLRCRQGLPQGEQSGRSCRHPRRRPCLLAQRLGLQVRCYLFVTGMVMITRHERISWGGPACWAGTGSCQGAGLALRQASPARLAALQPLAHMLSRVRSPAFLPAEMEDRSAAALYPAPGGTCSYGVMHHHHAACCCKHCLYAGIDLALLAARRGGGRHCSLWHIFLFKRRVPACLRLRMCVMCCSASTASGAAPWDGCKAPATTGGPATWHEQWCTR